MRKRVRILDFDLETRPLTFRGEHPLAQVTAAASCWVDDLGSIEVHPLLRDDVSVERILAPLLSRIAMADLVTGHNIRGFDLPIINAALLEAGRPALASVLTCDTYLDLGKRKDISVKQEDLLEMLDVKDVYGQPLRKFHMSQSMWYEANQLTEAGEALTIERVSSDVFAHMQLRLRLLELGWLAAPKLWRPSR